MRPSFKVTLAAALVGTAALGFAAPHLSAQGAGGPIARYDMRAETRSGFGAGMMGGGGRPGMGAMMGMAFGGGGGGGGYSHALTLELGSSSAPAGGAPKADHFMPAGARLGASVPLRSPEPGRVSEGGDTPERDFHRPKARMLVFWGCGEHAPKGQPVVIDFSRLAAGQVPPGLFTSTVPLDRWVSIASSRTYGHWPNDDRRQLTTQSSLLGAHKVVGNYSPPIAFTLAKDFMAPLRASDAAQPSGATLLSWNAVPEATGYYAFLFGAKGAGRDGEPTDLVWWSSSATRQFGGGLSDWLSPGTVARLVTAGTVLPPARTQCAVPAEVKQAAGEMMITQLTAYGPEESFAYPSRPTGAGPAWHPEWVARIRHRSATSLMLGIPGMGGMGRADDEQDQREEKPKCRKRGGFGGLGGALGGMLGSGGGC